MCRIKRRGKGSTLGAMGRFILGNLRMITETEGDMRWEVVRWRMGEQFDAWEGEVSLLGWEIVFIFFLTKRGDNPLLLFF